MHNLGLVYFDMSDFHYTIIMAKQIHANSIITIFLESVKNKQTKKKILLIKFNFYWVFWQINYTQLQHWQQCYWHFINIISIFHF